MTKKKMSNYNDLRRGRDHAPPADHGGVFQQMGTGAFVDGFKGSFRLAGELVKAVTEVGGQFVSERSRKR